METPAVILVEDADHCIATWDRTLIQIWRQATTEAAAARMCGHARAFSAKHPTGATMLFIVESTSQIPGSGARTEFARFTRESASKAALSVVVPEGGGFRSSLVRSILVGLSSLLGQAMPYKFADDVAAGIKLLKPHLSPASGGSDALHRALTELRARIARAK